MAIKDISEYAISEDSMSLVRLLEETLENVIALFESHGVPLPERRYWMLGPEVPEDCAQVVVAYVQSYLGIPGDQAAEAQNCNSPRTAVLNIVITRDYPMGERARPVSPERIMQASDWPAVDASVLSWGLNTIGSYGGMQPGPMIATVYVNAPSGAVQSTVLNLSVVVP
ncbi:hypothetical protein QEH42_gp090 [Microbacterium phage Pumpernickel]|uniref:Uncharacterized protein n=1 Tax=Microbacterium phage Pumpernickel TaxID=2885983 RepID=A0AAE9C3E5_9CAUD|nr:hypothetical protein QEH42_gp090 [Microbacterium phage Pumpernickel]UDL15881.1 hypothetical protein SEA_PUMPERNICKEL_90 [Microbacterium phage Pumpernickel]